MEVDHRIQCAWYKFSQHRHVLCNKNISIKLRLKLFDATVTPTILFGLAILPLSKASLKKITIVQKKMLRKIVGWIRFGEEAWDITMRRMKYRVNQTLQQYPMAWWTRRLATYLWKFAIRVRTSLHECWIVQSCEAKAKANVRSSPKARSASEHGQLTH